MGAEAEAEAEENVSHLLIDGPTGGPPMLASKGGFAGASGAAPPMLRRQNASRFSWPPDSQQEWCYISLSPREFAEHATRVLGETMSAAAVAAFFASHEADSRAYAAYAERWRSELDELRQLPR